MSDCERKGKWFSSCKFEPRYDVGPPVFSRVTKVYGDISKIIEAMKPRTYVKDVCVHCGKEIVRADEKRG